MTKPLSLAGLLLIVLHLIALAARAQAPAQAPSKQGTDPSARSQSPAPTRTPGGSTQSLIEAYLRNLYAFGPDFTVIVGVLKESPVWGLYEASVEVSKGDQKDLGTVYVSKDGRYLVRGEVADLRTDPLAENRSKIHLENSPSVGPANAAVTVVEYSDFQCPSCRQLHDVLRAVIKDYPKIRVAFKDFPLAQIHPWAMTAALAGRCSYQQNPAAFWKVYDFIFDNQQVISADNAWQKFLDFAAQAGLNQQDFRSCMSGSEATHAVQENLKEGQSLNISSTPTVFINGRRLVGPDRTLVDQYILYELNRNKK